MSTLRENVGFASLLLAATFCVHKDPRMAAAVDVVYDLNDLAKVGLSRDVGLELFLTA